MSYKGRKVISLSICLLLVLSMFAGNIAPVKASDENNLQSQAQFEDIDEHWAEQNIIDWIEKGLIKGYEDGSFRPDKSITRAEFITLVNNAFGFKEIASASFKDVLGSDWYAEDVGKAVAEGYITGWKIAQSGQIKKSAAKKWQRFFVKC